MKTCLAKRSCTSTISTAAGKYSIGARTALHSIVRRFGNRIDRSPVANGNICSSNEALLESRDTKLLTSLISGPESRFTFDEYHLGVSETGSVAALARKYGLTGLAAGLALLFGLFVWQSSVKLSSPTRSLGGAGLRQERRFRIRQPAAAWCPPRRPAAALRQRMAEIAGAGFALLQRQTGTDRRPGPGGRSHRSPGNLPTDQPHSGREEYTMTANLERSKPLHWIL